jgi:iron complex transport system ATP-binding protein
VRLTVFDAVLLGRRPHLGWTVERRDLEKVESVLETLSLEKFALRYLDELSGGEFQKVLLARALVQEPRVLLLDEPTSSLDLKNQLDMLATLQRVVRGHNVAALLSLHDLNTAFRFADRLLFLRTVGRSRGADPRGLRRPGGHSLPQRNSDDRTIMSTTRK